MSADGAAVPAADWERLAAEQTRERVLAEIGRHPEISGPTSTTGNMWEAIFTLALRKVPTRYLFVALAAQLVAEIVRQDKEAKP